MGSQRERAPGLGNPGLSNQQADELADTDHCSPAPLYRVRWRRQGHGPQERCRENHNSARVLFEGVLHSQPDLIDLTLEQWLGEAWGNRWHTHLALCCGAVHTSATPDGARHIGQVAAHRRDVQSSDVAEATAGRRGSVALTVIVHWSEADPGGGGS